MTVGALDRLDELTVAAKQSAEIARGKLAEYEGFLTDLMQHP